MAVSVVRGVLQGPKSCLAVLASLAVVLILFYSNQIIYGGNNISLEAVKNVPIPASKLAHFFSNYQWRKEYGELNGPDIPSDDLRVIRKLRKNYLYPPSKLAYNLSDPDIIDPSMGQAEKIREILNYKKNGFFVECGALDGETRSNTLYFERELGWEGLLIEADPSNFHQMRRKQRKAWTSDACLSMKPYPTMVSFQQKRNEGRISNYSVGYLKQGFVDAQCFPLHSFLISLNRTRVDYFSLDIEGLELQVLQTIPWDKVDIKTLSVEFIHDTEGKEAIRSYMGHWGYYVDSEVTHPDWLANDFIFVRKGIHRL